MLRTCTLYSVFKKSEIWRMSAGVTEMLQRGACTTRVGLSRETGGGLLSTVGKERN